MLRTVRAQRPVLAWGLSGAALFVVSAAALSGMLGAASCDSAEAHIYSAALFDTGRACLNPYAAIDIVSGPDGDSRCSPVCLVGNAAVYVSTVCPPYPDPVNWDTSGKSASCEGALAAFQRNDLCGSDGGSSNPIDGGDASDESS